MKKNFCWVVEIFQVEVLLKCIKTEKPGKKYSVMT